MKLLSWTSESRLVVGRMPSCEVVLNDSSISRRHADLVYQRDIWVVRDLGSTNGTFLNGVRLGRVEQHVRLGDVIRFGNIIMTVAELDEPRAASRETPKAPFEVTASTKRSCADSVNDVLMGVTKNVRPSAHLLGLLKTNQHMHKIDSLGEFLGSTLEDAVHSLGAQRGAVLLLDEMFLSLKVRAVFGGDRTDTKVFHSSTMAQKCFAQEASLLCQNVANESEVAMAGSVTEGEMSTIICALLRTPRKRLGVLHLDRGPMQKPFTAADLEMADALAATISTGIESAQMLLDKQHHLFLQTVFALAQAIDCRDSYTGGHTQRVTDYALLLAEELQVSSADYRLLQLGTPLHDIGKIGIDDVILRKPGQLTTEEFALVKTHPMQGVAILDSIALLDPVLPIVRNHHERWDGAGYPDGLGGEQISPLARIVTVADVFDALTSDRPYRSALSLEEALAILKKSSGTHFDPKFVQAFLRIRPRVEAILQNRKDLVETDSTRRRLQKPAIVVKKPRQLQAC